MLNFKQFLIESKKSRKEHFCWNDGDLIIAKGSLNEEGSYENPTHTENYDASEETEAHLNKSAKKHAKSFGKEHHDAIKEYKAYSLGLNGYHRNRIYEPKNDYREEQTKHMDHVTSGKTSHDMHVFRSFGADFPIHHFKTGDELHDKGYTGTSLNHKTTLSMSQSKTHDGHPIIAKIHVPKGSKGHYIDHHGYAFSHEKEFLLHRGTTFKVHGHSFDKNRGVHYINMSVHKQEDHK
jgi:hypothetical protein